VDLMKHSFPEISANQRTEIRRQFTGTKIISSNSRQTVNNWSILFAVAVYVVSVEMLQPK
jgi:hypothetical protein